MRPVENNNQNNQFAILAKYYDILNYNADYKKVADYIEDVFEIYQKKPRLVVDLACGTGNLTVELDKRGYDMTGLDLSAEMLSVAVSKTADSKAANSDILWLNQDMCGFELYGTVDAVVCCFDSLNYVLAKENIEKCFALVYNYLNPGGLFIFDVNSKYKFEYLYAKNNFVLAQEQVFCSWQNYYNKKNKTCDFYMTLFVLQPDGKYKRYEETQREKYHSVKFLKEILIDTGFDDLNIFYDFSVNAKPRGKNKKCGRVCFAALKI
jgi:predicted TPR repeat methyltransferase